MISGIKMSKIQILNIISILFLYFYFIKTTYQLNNIIMNLKNVKLQFIYINTV